MKNNIIKEKRKEAGLTALKVSKMLGITERQYYRLEALGIKNKNLKTIYKLSKILDMDLLELFYYLAEIKEGVV